MSNENTGLSPSNREVTNGAPVEIIHDLDTRKTYVSIPSAPRPMKLRAKITEDGTLRIQKRFKEGWFPLVDRPGAEPEDAAEIIYRINAFEPQEGQKGDNR